MSDEMLTRRAPGARADKLNVEERTVEVVWAAGARVRRRDIDGPFMEELSMDPKHVRLERLNAGASLLDAHDSLSMKSRVGSVVPGSARITGGKGYATVRLSAGGLGETLLQDLIAGHRLQISVGYRTHRAERIDGDEDELPISRAVDWEPLELSAVPIPADAGAHTRTLKEPTKMAKSARTQARTPPPIEPDEDDLDLEAADQARNEERERVLQIESIGRRADMSSRMVRRHIEQGTSVEEFRTETISTLARRSEIPPSGYDDRHERRQDNLRDDIVTGVASLLGAPLTDKDPQRLVGRSILEIGRHYLDAAGVDTRGMRDAEVARVLTRPHRGFLSRGIGGMHTTSDFPTLLEEGAQRALLDRYQAAPSVLKAFSHKRNAQDFRPVSFVRPGETPPLEIVNEHGEIKSGTLEVEQQGFKILSWGRIFALTFQALANDDLGAFNDFVDAFSDSATMTEGNVLYGLLAANNFGGAKLSDGKNFFHADHGNLAASGGVISETTVGTAEEKMRGQKNVNAAAAAAQGRSVHGPAGMAPATLLVGPKRAIAARKFVAEVNATKTEDVNTFSGKLSVAVEDRYDGVGWWLFAAKPAFVYGYLDGGSEGPQVETKDGWTILGTEYRCTMHFGAGPYDYRAAYFNPGA